MNHHWILIVAMLAAPVLGGCQNNRGPIMRMLFGPIENRQTAERLASESYPVDAPIGDDLDIVLIRQKDKIVLANRTAHSFKNVQLWLNQQYVGQIDQIHIGSDHKFNQYPAVDFINEFAEPFPTGGLLNPDKTYPIVLAELYDAAGDKKRHRLSVRYQKKKPR